MKRIETFSKSDLIQLRKEIVLNSIYIWDYVNTFGISAKSICAFFDGYVDYLFEIAKENGDGALETFALFEKYDNPDNLERWYFCYDNFSWVEYEE